MDNPALTRTILHETPSYGFQKRLALLCPTMKRTRCYLAGGIPYAQPPTRFQRAKPLLTQTYQFGTQTTPTDYAHLSHECPQPQRAQNVSEDCLQLNIWIPASASKKPSGGWPVLFFIHGGFLQWGSNRSIEPSALLGEESPVEAVIVAPNYRLNAFGFLMGRELQEEAEKRGECAGNIGFWDQRCALEWTARNVGLYGGDPANITAAGLSAGSYSTFHQLAFEVGLPDEEVLIQRVTMFSNGCGLEPKAPAEVQSHYQMLLKALGIDVGAPAEKQLERLRAEDQRAVVEAVRRIPENAFRAVTDGKFVRSTLFSELRSGSFARTLKRRGVKVMIGEVRDEVNSYRLISPPSSYKSLVSRLAVEYPEAASEKLARYYCQDGALPSYCKSWQDLFGRIYADFQVHCSERGLLNFLYPTLPIEDIFRYRVNYRTKSADKAFEPKLGVCHATDMSIWFFGNGLPLTVEEKTMAHEWLEPWAAFLKGEKFKFGTGEIGQFRCLDEDGKTIRVEVDREYKHAVRTFKAVDGGRESKI